MRRINIRLVSLVVLIFAFLTFCVTDCVLLKESQEIKNLRAFTKLYGYIKYFHPSDEASQIDWDKFAAFGVKHVIDAKNNKELKITLDSLFLPIAPTIQIYSSNKIPESQPKIVPDDTSSLHLVAWQHYGVRLSERSNLYRSMRLNRNILGGLDGSIIQRIEADKYRGMKIKLNAAVRSEVTYKGNHGQLIIRVDRKDKQHGFFDNMSDKPIMSPEWKRYEIIGEVADDAERIVFGCTLVGLGKVWVDDFKLSVKNENNKWIPVDIKDPDFEEESVGGSPDKWLKFNDTPFNSFILIKKNPYSEEKALLIKTKELLFDTHPFVGEIFEKDFGSNLSCRMPLAMYSDSIATLA